MDLVLREGRSAEQMSGVLNDDRERSKALQSKIVVVFRNHVRVPVAFGEIHESPWRLLAARKRMC